MLPAFLQDEGKGKRLGLLGMAGSHGPPATVPAQTLLCQPRGRTTAAKATVSPEMAPAAHPSSRATSPELQPESCSVLKPRAPGTPAAGHGGKTPHSPALNGLNPPSSSGQRPQDLSMKKAAERLDGAGQRTSAAGPHSRQILRTSHPPPSQGCSRAATETQGSKAGPSTLLLPSPPTQARRQLSAAHPALQDPASEIQQAQDPASSQALAGAQRVHRAFAGSFAKRWLAARCPQFQK